MTTHTGRAGGDASGPSSELASIGEKNRNDTIDCLLNLRSVRDQFKDAELDLSNNKVAQQLEDLEGRLVDHLAEERKLRDGVGLLTVAVVGDFNSGKSTFINALLGTQLCPVGDEPTTASVTHFIHGDRQRFELECDGTRKSIARGKYLSMVRHGKVGDREAYVFHVSMDSPVLEHVRLVDTPGFNAPPPNNNDTRVTEQAVVTADALFVITDVSKGNPSKTLLEQLERLRHSRRTASGPPAFLLLNKSESVPPTRRQEVKRICEKQYDDRFRSVIPVSALRLNDTDDAAPLDTLETTARRIRVALSRQEPFEVRVSAKAVTEGVQATYRVDIDGNVYQASVSADGDLASREQLAALVRSVAAERHSLLETQYRRRTSQLRKDWLKAVSGLDSLCKRAARASCVAGEPTDERGNEALKAIDDAKDFILDRGHGMFHEAAEDAVSKGQWKEPGILWSTTFYYVEVCLDAAVETVDTHDCWAQIKTIVRRLVRSLKLLRATEVGTIPDPLRITERLRDQITESFRKSLELYRQALEESEHWEPHEDKRWRQAYEDEEAREDGYDRLARFFASSADRWTLHFSQSVQITIDNLQEAIIRYEEKGRATARDQEGELMKLRERIDELKVYIP